MCAWLMRQAGSAQFVLLSPSVRRGNKPIEKILEVEKQSKAASGGRIACDGECRTDVQVHHDNVLVFGTNAR
jgi:hypothetical protein